MIRDHQGKENDKVVILRLMNLIGGQWYASRIVIISVFASYASISRLYDAL